MQNLLSATAQRIVAEYRNRYRHPRQRDPIPSEPVHHLEITAKRGTNGKVLVVRCWCMSGVSGPPRLYYVYDPLGEATTLPDAVAIYRQHLASKSS